MRNYFVRHWRGELSLPVSYWLNNLLVTAFIICGVLAIRTLDFAEYPATISFLAIAFWGLAGLASVWLLVGVWRSADNHVSRGGSSGWASAARFAVFLAVVRFLAEVATTAVPQIREFASIIVGDEALSGYTVRLLRNDTEIEVTGPIGFGLTAEVKRKLDAHPAVKVIHLNSEGGRVAEARKLAALIQQRNLNTYTATQCASACVIAFAAGNERLITPDAKIGMHRYSFAGREDLFEDEYRTDAAFFASRGISADFVAKAHRTPATSIWTPTLEELRSARLVTGTAEFGEFGVSGYREASFEKEVNSIPLYAALKEHEPAVYHRVLAAMRAGMVEGKTLKELRQRSMPEIENIVAAKLPLASNETLLDFTQVMVEELDALAARDPALCFAFLFHPEDVDPTRYFPQGLQKRDLEASAQIIRTASAANGITRTSTDDSLASVIDYLIDEFGQDVRLLANPSQAEDRKARVCSIVTAMYKHVLQLPKAESAPLLRHLFAQAPPPPASAPAPSPTPPAARPDAEPRNVIR